MEVHPTEIAYNIETPHGLRWETGKNLDLTSTERRLLYSLDHSARLAALLHILDCCDWRSGIGAS
jgi:hypothetical protein